MSDNKIIYGDNFESGGGDQYNLKDQATLIQAKEVHLSSRQPMPPVVPRDLQPLDACFRGRDKELSELMKQLQPGKVAAVCGPGGMGKSALAAQAVNRLEKDRFPDGIVFHSFYGHPETEQALQAVCTAFQVEAKTSLTSTVRQVLSGKKALLILDGTEEAEDLKAVLDLRSTCGVLITSRKRSDAPGSLIEVKRLDELPAAEAFRLYSNTAADETTVQAVCEQLGGWPLALRIAGHYLRSTGESAADYLRWLEKEPLKELGDGEHQEENAALLLRRSVAQVSEDARLALGVAGTLAFAPIAREPVAAVLEDDERRARKALGELVNYGLLETREQRWQVSHALVHTYARTELTLSTEIVKRMAWYYIHFCDIQNNSGLEGYVQLDRERLHYLRLIKTCLNSKLWQEVQGLVLVIQEYLDRQGWWTERLTALKMSLTAAQQTCDRSHEGSCLNDLGYTYELLGKNDLALECFEQSLRIHCEVCNKKGESRVLNNIAGIYRQQGKCKRALQYYKQSLRIAREINDLKTEGATLNNIATVYHKKSCYEQALCYYQQCLSVIRQTRDKKLEGGRLNNIAAIYYAQGNYGKALEYNKQSLAICREVSDLSGEAGASWWIGLSYKNLGDLDKAEECINQAVQIMETIDHPKLETCRKELEQVQAKRQGA
ncbi:MAG: tetratricopeptide repeat protein [Candidatus Electrothrix scaldis]|nr:MAG: tetratricopeptide repeat protein [Candidatus Electrothrix sp. GW3-3]